MDRHRIDATNPDLDSHQNENSDPDRSQDDADPHHLKHTLTVGTRGRSKNH